MTSASRLTLKVHLARQYFIWDFFRIEIVVSVKLVKSIHELPPVAYAGSCAFVDYDNDVNPGFYDYEAEGAALNV
eukprot:5096602-Pyramimonas_sp.AAC.1